MICIDNNKAFNATLSRKGSRSRIRPDAAYRFKSKKWKFSNLDNLCGTNVALANYIKNRFRIEATKVAIVERSGRVGVVVKDSETLKNRIFKYKQDLLNTILENNPITIQDSTGETVVISDATKDVFILNTEIGERVFYPEAYRAVLSNQIVNIQRSESLYLTLNPYDPDSQITRDKFYATYILSNFDDMIKSILGEEIELGEGAGCSNNDSYELVAFSDDTNRKINESEELHNLTTHVSKRMKTLFSSIPVVYKNADGKYHVVPDVYMRESVMYTTAGALRMAEEEFMNDNPDIDLNLDADPYTGLKVLLSLAVDAPITEDDIKHNGSTTLITLRKPRSLMSNRNSIYLHSLYAYLFGTTIDSNDRTLPSLLNCAFKKEARRALTYIQQELPILLYDGNIFNLLVRELLKVQPLSYIHLLTTMSPVDFQITGSSNNKEVTKRIRRSYISAPHTLQNSLITYASNLSNFVHTFSNPKYTDADYDELKKIPASNYTIENIKNNIFLKTFIEKLLKILELEREQYDAPLDYFLTNIDLNFEKPKNGSTENQKALKAIFDGTIELTRKLRKLKNYAAGGDINAHKEQVELESRVSRELLGVLNKHESLILNQLSCLYNSDLVMNIHKPDKASTSLPNFGLPALIFKDAYMKHLYLLRGFKKSDNFFTRYGKLFSADGSLHYPGGTVILNGLIDAEGSNKSYLTLDEHEAFIAQFFGMFYSTLNCGDLNFESFLMWHQTTYSDKTRAFFKCINGNTEIEIPGFKDPTPIKKFISTAKLDDILELDYLYRKHLLLQLWKSIIETYYLLLDEDFVYWEDDDSNKILKAKPVLDSLEKLLSKDPIENYEQLKAFKVDELMNVIGRLLDYLPEIDFDIRAIASDLGLQFIEEIHMTKYGEASKEDLPYKDIVNFHAGNSLNRCMIDDLYLLSSFDTFKANKYKELDKLFDDHKEFLLKEIIRNYDLYSASIPSGDKLLKNIKGTDFSLATLNEILAKTAVGRWLFFTNFLRHLYFNLTLGEDYKDVAKGNFATVEEERSARLASSTKRTIGYTSTKEESMQGLINGVSKDIKICIVKKSELPCFSINGGLSDQSIYDGAGHIDPKLSLLENISYGQGKWDSKKTFGQTFAKGLAFSTIYKWAEFPVSNASMRNKKSKHKMVALFKKMNSIRLDGTERDPNLHITSDMTIGLTGANYMHDLLNGDLPYFYYDYNIASYKRVLDVKCIDPKNRVYQLITQTCDKHGIPISDSVIEEPETSWNSLYDIFEAFHGIDCASLNDSNSLQFSESIHELMTHMVINFGTITNPADANKRGLNQFNTSLPLRKAFISIAATTDAIKNGQININSNNVYGGKNDLKELNYYEAESALFGKSLEASHVADGNTTIHELTLTLSAITLLGYKLGEASAVYTNIYDMIQDIVNDVFKTSSDKLIKEILDQLKLKNSGDITAIIVDKCKKYNISVPYNNDLITRAITKGLMSRLNSDMIRRSYSGLACVLNPSSAIYLMIRVGDTEGMLYEGIMETAIEMLDNNSIIKEDFLQAVQDIKMDTEDALFYLGSLLIDNSKVTNSVSALARTLGESIKKYPGGESLLKDYANPLEIYKFILQNIKNPTLAYDLYLLSKSSNKTEDSEKASIPVTLFKVTDLLNRPQIMDFVYFYNIEKNSNIATISDDDLIELLTHAPEKGELPEDSINLLQKVDSLLLDKDGPIKVLVAKWVPTELLPQRYTTTVVLLTNKDEAGNITEETMDIDHYMDLLSGARVLAGQILEVSNKGPEKVDLLIKSTVKKGISEETILTTDVNPENC